MYILSNICLFKEKLRHDIIKIYSKEDMMSDKEIIANIKSLGIDMINQAKSGHPGIVLGAAPILYSLYANHLNINTKDYNWFNRDRFVMSAGHGSALLYATLFMSGFPLSLDDLKQFRQINSKTPGHPEVYVTPGVDCSTGPLGQGIATAVGMALGEKILHERYRIDEKESLVDYKIYVLVGDGDLMEGISYEAASLAGTLKLNNLIVIYDSNDISLDGPTNKTFTENTRDRFDAMGWTTSFVHNGNNLTELNYAISHAKKANAPAFIEVKTKIGDGSLLEGTSSVHGKCLTTEDIYQLKEKLGLPQDNFYYNPNCIDYLKSKINSRVDNKYQKTNKLYNAYLSSGKDSVEYLFNREVKYDLFSNNWNLDEHQKEATRDTNKIFMDYLNHNIKNFVGGSADLGSTTKTYDQNLDDISKDHFDGSNIWFGVREHAMGAILNGMALVGLKPYGSTFLSFSDYIKPAIRMSSLMALPVIYIFSHDSIYVGPDGPTHQPIEQLAMLRSIPKMKVFRPSDINELLGCWQVIINTSHNPSSLILSRNEVERHPNTSAKGAALGGYIYYQEKGDLDTILIATGTELTYARNIGYELLQKGYNNFRIVSMPSVEQFLENDDSYKQKVLPLNTKKIVIEAGSSFGWHRISKDNIYYITLDSFGSSGLEQQVLEYMHFSYEDVKKRVLEIMDIK